MKPQRIVIIGFFNNMCDFVLLEGRLFLGLKLKKCDIHIHPSYKHELFLSLTCLVVEAVDLKGSVPLGGKVLVSHTVYMFK